MYKVEITNKKNICVAKFPKHIFKKLDELEVKYELGDVFKVNNSIINIPKHLQRIVVAADVQIKSLDRDIDIEKVFVNGFKCLKPRHIVKYLELDLSYDESIKEMNVYKEIISIVIEQRLQDIKKIGLLHDLLQCGGINVKG